MSTPTPEKPKDLTPSVNFIEEIIQDDLKSGKHQSIMTRFPPEPNGYLHIGHAKAMCIDFGLAEKYGGKCNLRFDDTNPVKEDVEYVDAIKEDIHWLGFNFAAELYASDYFELLYQWAEKLIQMGKAYVCDLSAEEVSKTRGSLTGPGQNSPGRDRSVEENLDLFRRMRKGEFPDGARTLRSKIDMSHPNVMFRDPVMYRIIHAPPHHRTGNQWVIYPMYDWAHGQNDSMEKITHSICTLEYEIHRPLYEWYIKELGIFPVRQIEFARLNLTYTMMSKRRLLELVKTKIVRGWDDPRMPTLCGLRRRGYTPESIKNFCVTIGVSKYDSTIEMYVLENAIREDLNKRAHRTLAVLKPLKLIIDNYPEGQVDELDAVNNPEDPSAGTRKVPFSRELYIEQSDFMEVPPKKYFRLAPDKEVRLRYGYYVRCVDFKKDSAGNVTEVHCTYDPATRGGQSPDGRKVQGTIHWVSTRHAIQAEVRLYDHLFAKPDPDDVPEGQDWKANLNPNSLVVVTGHLEPSLKDVKPGDRVQFERLGYFCVDKDSAPGKLVFNRTVTLADTWAKIEKKDQKK